MAIFAHALAHVVAVNGPARKPVRCGHRLRLAVAASLLLHAMLIVGVRSQAPERGTPAILEARIVPVSAVESAAVALAKVPDIPKDRASPPRPQHVPEAANDAPPDTETAGAGDPVQPSRALPHYYAAQDVDVRAAPRDVSNRSRQEAGMLLGRIVKVKLQLYISAAGNVDRFDVVEADGLTQGVSLGEVYEIRFHPALKNGLPVASRKLVQLSFVP